ncbi:MAG: DUF420 domain-containing protein [Bacteroidota bacterium]
MSTISNKTVKVLNRWALALSIIIPLAVAILLNPAVPKISLPFDPYVLPKIHATVNALTVITLLIALYFIKQRNIEAHQKTIYVALGLSVVFLLSYILYHGSTEPTSYGGEGTMKSVYYFLLITHIILAAGIVPFVLYTFIRGYTRQDEKHRKLAKITFPLWLYVASTGVICYLMLAPYYPS